MGCQKMMELGMVRKLFFNSDKNIIDLRYGWICGVWSGGHEPGRHDHHLQEGEGGGLQHPIHADWDTDPVPALHVEDDEHVLQH